MRVTRYFLTVSFVLLTSLCVQAQTSKSVIQNVTVISMDPTRPMAEEGMDVFIDGGAIVKIAKSTKSHPSDADLINGTGKYLIPGLADMHAHLPRATSTFSSKDFYLLNLLHGVTTLRQMRGAAQDLVLRDSVRKGLLLGCNTYISTPPMFWMDSAYSSKWFNAAMCRDSLVKFKQEGYDLVKYLGGLTDDQFDTLVKIAGSLGLKVTGHAPKNDLTKAVELNQYSIEHIPPFVDLYLKDSVLFWKTIDTMIAKQLVCCPDIRFYVMDCLQTGIEERRSFAGVEYLSEKALNEKQKNFSEYVLSLYHKDPSAFIQYVQRDSIRVAAFMQIMPEMQKRGVKFLVSPGSGEFFVPGASYVDELELFVESNLTAYEALKCATCNAAESLGELSNWGTITVGKRADLVLLNSDPLQDIRNVRKIDATIIGGTILTPSVLLSMLKN